jgi:hypothetical protein
LTHIRPEAGDLLAFLYAAVLAREVFWWTPGTAAWVASFGVAVLLGFLRLRARRIRRSLPAPFWLGFVAPLGIFWALHLPYPDSSWDVLNYHLLHGERAARGLLAIPGDFYPYYFPYLNPAPDILNTVLRWVLGYRLGTVGGFLALIWTGAILFRVLTPAIASPRIRALTILWIVGSEGILWEVGNYMVDLYGLPLLLEATVLALPQDDHSRDPLKEVPLLGLLLGSAVAFKLTNFVFAAAIGVVFLGRVFGDRAIRASRKRLALGLALAALAFLLPNAAHTFYLLKTTGSPVFPHYNALFRSPLFPAFNIRDGRFGPRSIPEAIVWPLTSAVHAERLSELARTSGRLALGFLGALLVLFVGPRDRLLPGLAIIVVAGSILWSFGTGNHRYGLFAELVGSLVLVLLAAPGLSRASEKRGVSRLVAALPAALLGIQSLLVLWCLVPGDWAGRPTALHAPRTAWRELRLAGSDRDLRRELPAEIREALPTIAGWVDAAPRTSGLMALLAPELPMIGLRLEPVFDVPANLDRYSEALWLVRGHRLVSLAFGTDLESARSELTRRGYIIRGEYSFDLPFFSGFTHFSLVALDLKAPRLLHPYPDGLARILGGCRQDGLLIGGLDTLPRNGDVRGPLVVKGWARIPGEDLDVRILIDGVERVPGPARRYPRPDVCAALPQMADCTKAGFEARFEFEEGDEGRHEITAIFFSRDGRCRVYPPARFSWKP